MSKKLLKFLKIIILIQFIDVINPISGLYSNNIQIMNKSSESTEFIKMNNQFKLKDFFSKDSELDSIVDSIINALIEDDLVSQMIITSFGKYGNDPDMVLKLIGDKKVGGVIFLENTREEIKKYAIEFTEEAKKVSIVLPIFSVDAEPSLINRRIKGLKPYPLTNSISDVNECRAIAQNISKDLRRLGIHVNYAPVCDIALNSEIVGNRSFGKDRNKISVLANEFIVQMQKNQIAATAKHFPGHGYASGDSHKNLVYINGKLNEIDIFRRAIKTGVIFVMVGHIAVKNNSIYDTNNRPSILSKEIVTELLKNKLGFKGIVITDAMNMKAVSNFEFAPIYAIRAGCDMVLMPLDEGLTVDRIKSEMRLDPFFRNRVLDSVRKIIRLKVCLGLVQNQSNICR